MPSRWIEFVRDFANRNNLTYGCALSTPACKEEYRKKYGVSKKVSQKKERERMGEEDVRSRKVGQAEAEEKKRLVELSRMMGEDTKRATPADEMVKALREAGKDPSAYLEMLKKRPLVVPPGVHSVPLTYKPKAISQVPPKPKKTKKILVIEEDEPEQKGVSLEITEMEAPEPAPAPTKRSRGRPKKYATAEEAKKAKYAQTNASKRRKKEKMKGGAVPPGDLPAQNDGPPTISPEELRILAEQERMRRRRRRDLEDDWESYREEIEANITPFDPVGIVHSLDRVRSLLQELPPDFIQTIRPELIGYLNQIQSVGQGRPRVLRAVQQVRNDLGEPLGQGRKKKMKGGMNIVDKLRERESGDDSELTRDIRYLVSLLSGVNPDAIKTEEDYYEAKAKTAEFFREYYLNVKRKFPDAEMNPLIQKLLQTGANIQSSLNEKLTEMRERERYGRGRGGAVGTAYVNQGTNPRGVIGGRKAPPVPPPRAERERPTPPPPPIQRPPPLQRADVVNLINSVINHANNVERDFRNGVNDPEMPYENDREFLLDGMRAFVRVVQRFPHLVSQEERRAFLWRVEQVIEMLPGGR